MNAKIVRRLIPAALVILLIVVAAGLKSIFVRREAFQRGVVYASWWHGEYSSAESDTTLSQNIEPMGVNWISLVVTCYQDTIVSTTIRCDPERHTPTDADVVHVIGYARSLGLRVMLKPHVDLAQDDDHWRAEIDLGGDESAWQAWFQSYTDFITHYATLAQVTGADYLVIGTELAGTSKRGDDWRAVVKAVRQVYAGPITYAANHGGEEAEILWWDAVDAIGVDAYYSLTQSNQPTVEELKAAWSPIVSRLGLLSKRWNRPVILTEVGYQSVDGTNRAPWNAGEATIDLQEQADCYQALFESFAGQEWWQGVFWWAWSVDPNQGGPSDGGFTANNKPAEDVLRLYYGAPPSVAQSRP